MGPQLQVSGGWENGEAIGLEWRPEVVVWRRRGEERRKEVKRRVLSGGDAVRSDQNEADESARTQDAAASGRGECCSSSTAAVPRNGTRNGCGR